MESCTNNETSFYRGTSFYDYLRSTEIPHLFSKKPHLVWWSMAGSSCEEAYTLGMCLEEYVQKNPEKQLSYSVIATDISEKALQVGRAGTYSFDKVCYLPPDLRKNFMTTDLTKGRWNVDSEIKAKVKIVHQNLVEPLHPSISKIDTAVCRNLLYYLSGTPVFNLFNRTYDRLNPDGTLYIQDVDWPFCKNSLPKNLKPVRIQKRGDFHILQKS
jgi:chemotaxis methyl-accepting protein methylase